MSFEQIHDRMSLDPKDETAVSDLRSQILRWVIDDRIMDHLVVGGEDVINGAIYSVLVTFRNSRGRETFKGFVRGHYLNARKKAWRDPEVVPLDLQVHDRFDDGLPITDFYLGECLETLRDANPKQFRAVMMRDFNHCEYSEIALRLGIAPDFARQTVSRGHRALRECLTQKKSNDGHP